MAYGLPAYGETGWKTKLDASIEAVKATADAAQSAAGLDVAVAGKVGDPASSTRTALSGVYARSSGSVFLDDFLAAGRIEGTTDDTAALQAAVNAAAGKRLVLGIRALRLQSTVTISANNTTVDATGTTINLIDDGTAAGVRVLISDCSRVTWIGGTLNQTAAARSGVYGLMSAVRVDGLLVDAVRVVGGASAAFYGQQLTNFTIRNFQGEGSKADGIHISRGSTDGQIICPRITNSEDDAIAVVSVMADGAINYGQCARITVVSPIVNGTVTLGGGVAFIGPKDCSLVGGILKGTASQAVKVTTDAVAGTHAPLNVSVVGTRVIDCAAGYWVGSSTDTLLEGVTAQGCADYGIGLINATRAQVRGGKSRGNVGGVYESGGSGNRVDGVDLTGNTGYTAARVSAVFTNCVGYNTKPYVSAITLRDTFDRPDNSTTIGLAESGQVPTVYSGTWGVFGKAAYNPVSGTGQVVWDVGSTDMQVTAQLTAFGAAGQYHGVIARASDANNFYWADAESGGGVRLFKRVGGTNTQLGTTVAAGFVAGDTISLSVQDSSIVVYRNGAAVISATDNSLTLGTAAGFRNGGTSTSQTWGHITVRALA